MPNLNIVSIGQTGAEYYVDSLSNDWNQSNYSQMYLCTSPASSSGTSGIASLGYRPETWIEPPATGTSRTTNWGDITGLSPNTTYTLYANVQTPAQGLWFPAGGRTFTTQAQPDPIPPPVTNLRTLSVGDGRVTLGWDAMSYATSYEIHWTPANLTGSTSNVSSYANYEFVNMQNGVNYSVTVYSKNASGMSAGRQIVVQSQGALTTPVGTPTVSVSWTNLQAYVSWNSISGGGTTHYEVARKQSSSGTWIIWTNDTTATGIYIDVDLANTNYDFYVRPFNSYGSGTTGYKYNSTSGQPIQNVPPPVDPPINMLRRWDQDPYLDYLISFNGNGSPRYKITKQRSGQSEVILVQDVDHTTAVNGLYRFDEQNTLYTVRVYAGNAIGYSSPLAQSFTTGTIIGTPTGAPSVSLQYSRVGGVHYVNVYWTSVTDATFYKIYANDGTSGDVLKNSNATGTQAQITVDKADTLYTIKVQACSSSGCANVSGSNTIRTTLRPQLFSWWTPKNAGGEFNVAAAEWNALTKNIDDLRNFKGLGPYGFTNAVTNNEFQAFYYNQVVNALKAFSPAPPTAPPPNRSTNDLIYAADFNQIVSSLNSIP